MIKLVKNELTKIFHKKSIYIILIIILLFMATVNILNKVIGNAISYYEDNNIAFYEEALKSIDKNDPQNRESIIGLETNLEVAKLVKKYGKDSWQAYILKNKGTEIITNMKYADGTENYEKAKNEYDIFLKRLENNDWRAYVKEELDDVNTSINDTENILKGNITEQEKSINEVYLMQFKDRKQALEWRLEKDISYSKSNLNTFVENWLSYKDQINSINANEKVKVLTYSEKCDKQQAMANVALLENAIEKKVNEKIEAHSVNGTYILSTNLDADFISAWSEYSVFIIIAICMIAGTIVSEEFNKGTIKLLLVRPYKRIKILMAKFITCLIILALVLIFVGIAQYVVGGIANGIGNYSRYITIYNFNNNSIESISLLNYSLITAVSKLPMFILLMTLSFTLSVVFNNSPVAIALPLVGTMGSEIINQIAYNFEKAKFLRFFVTPNWDLSIYLFGKMPEFEPISLEFSIVVCVVYFVMMLIMSIGIFKNRDIKNI